MKPTHQVDYAIIGQGLAGSLIAHFLLERGKTVHVFDNGHRTSSSVVAAGIINPITGWRFVKSWRIDELLPFAKQTYRHLEQQLDASFLTETDIIRSIHSQKDRNNWLLRSTLPDYAPYMQDEVDWNEFIQKIRLPYSAGTVRKSCRLNCEKFLNEYKLFLTNNGSYTLTEISPEDMNRLSGGLPINGLVTKAVIDCRGYRAKQEGSFGQLPFGGSKGEVLLVKIPGANFTRLFKNRIFIVPMEDDLYWVGSAYENDFEDDRPTEQGKQTLREKLEAALRMPYEIVDHRAAIRPTVKDRRPFLGTHPQISNLHIFNGLGTKGASLGPFFANRLAAYLCEGVPLEDVVNIARFD